MMNIENNDASRRHANHAPIIVTEHGDDEGGIEMT